jgi:hypothetical protein
MGGLKETVLGDMLQKNPRRVIELSVRGMLPRNRLARHLLRHLKVYAGPDHPHVAQVNASLKPRRPVSAARTVPKARSAEESPPTTKRRRTTAKPAGAKGA